MVISSNSMKYALVFIAAFIFIELVFLNVLIIYSYASIKNTVSPILNPRSNNFVDILSQYKIFKNVLNRGKSGGFVRLMQETLERTFVILPGNKDDGRIDKLGFVGLDVSESGEATFIYKRIMSRKTFLYSHLVVDIGANEGFVSSNSFNFIQWGWSAILVEPDKSKLDIAKKNIQRYIDPYRDLNHTVRFVPAFISERDGMVQFPIKDRNGMTGNQASQDSRDSQLQKNLNLDTQNSALKEPQIKVRSISVKTFVQDLHIPQFFGVLSIDTKGVGDLVIHGFISLGFRPAYIIYEHESEETWEAAAKYFAGKEYKCLTRRGKNFILEHIPKSKRKDNLNSYMYNFF